MWTFSPTVISNFHGAGRELLGIEVIELSTAGERGPFGMVATIVKTAERFEAVSSGQIESAGRVPSRAVKVAVWAFMGAQRGASTEEAGGPGTWFSLQRMRTHFLLSCKPEGELDFSGCGSTGDIR